jgi:hypothetical protein
MAAAKALYTAMEIRDALGQHADGCPIEPELMPFTWAAVTGGVPDE